MENTLTITAGILIGCLIGLSWFAGSDAPYVPTKWEKLKKIFKLINLKPGQKFYELGSGDGRVVLEAAKHGAIAYGIEQSWIRIWMSKYQAMKQNLSTAHFIHGNIFNPSFWQAKRRPESGSWTNHDDKVVDADVVFIYLLPKGIDKLEPKLKKELSKGAIIITQTYHFKNWQPIQKDGDFWVYQV